MSASNKRPVAGSRSPARPNTSADAPRRMRMGLLGSTALIAAGLVGSPALAQVVVGAGTITYTSGTPDSETPGASDGVSIVGFNANQSTINNVSILNTTGDPWADAVRLTVTSGVNLTGLNSLRTDVGGGSALYVQSNANLGVNFSSSNNTFTGSYGIRALAAGGFINFNSTGRTQTITGNGTALIGIDVAAYLHPEVYFGTSVVSGFATGVQLTQAMTSGGYVLFSSTGGSINATGTGIRADAVNGSAEVNSQTAITAPIGINATGGAVTVTTSGGGTINSTVAGTGTGIIASGSGGTSDVTVNVGAAIGGTTRFGTGVNASTTGGTGIVNVVTTAAITAGTGISMNAVNGATANVQGAITASTGVSSSTTGGVTNITTSGAGTLNALSAGSGAGINATTSGSGAINVTVGAAIGDTTVFADGVVISTLNPSTALINFHNTAAITASTASSTNSGLEITLWNSAGRNTVDVEADITGGRGVYTTGGGVYDFVVRSGATVTAAAANGHGINSNNSGNTITNAGVIRATGAGGYGAQIYGLQSFTNSGTVEGAEHGIWLLNTATINNTGTISGGTGGGILGTGATVNNTGGTISGNTGISANGNPANITNSAGGLITGVVDGINLSSNVSGTLNNSATINTGGGASSAAGVYLSRTSVSGYVINNTGTITGGADATLGYAINVEDGITFINNNSGGQIAGLTGLASGQAIRLNSDDAATLNINAGSTVTGGILSINTGARTVSIAGLLDGDYNASGGSGVDTITLASTGSITGDVVLGGGADTFNWNGGTISGTLDGGSDYGNTLAVALGAGVSRTLSGGGAFFSTKTLTSGNLSLTGNVDSATTWQVSGANSQLIFDGIFGSGATLATASSNGTITIASGRTYSGTNIVINSGTLNNNGTMTGGAYAGSPSTFYTHAVNFNGTGTVNNTGVMQTGAFDYTAPVFSRFGALITVNNSGRIAGDIAGTANITDGIRNHGGSLIVNNQTATSIIRGSQSAIVTTGSGGVTLTNAGIVTGGVDAVNSAGSGAITNLSGGVIGTGAVDDAGAFSAGGTGNAINLSGGGTINNSGMIRGAGAGIFASAGTLTLTNASGGTISGGTASVQVGTSGTATLDLQAGSTTTGDVILTGTGARTLTIAGAFNGFLNATGNSGAVNLNLNTSATGYTLLEAGSGADTLTFAGSGSRTFSVDNLTSWNTGAFTGGAWTLTGTGNATSFVSGLALSGGSSVSISDTLQLQGATGLSMTGGASIVTTASLSNTRTISMLGAGGLTVASGQTLTQSGVVSGAGVLSLNGPGTVVLSGNNTYTGGTVVNAGILRLGHTSAAGTGLIRMIDPQIDFAAAGTYNNNISLEVVDGQQAADPTILNNTSGGGVTLAGRIYETAGVGGAGQYVTINGGAITLTNGLNNWAGVTRINSGATLLGTTGTISGASIVNNGALTYQNVSAGTASQNISGSGAININGTGVTLAGAITTTGQLTISGPGSSLILGGSRSGASNTGVVLSATGGSLTVANGASLQSGQYNGVRVTGANASVTNLGLIQNAGTGGDGTVGAGVYVLNGGAGGTTTVNNGSITDTGAGSTIQGRNAGVRHESGSTDLLVVNNYGLIVGDLYNGVENTAGSLTVNNFSGGYVTAVLGNGVSSASAGAVDVTNAGVIGRNIAGTVTVNGYGVTTNGVLTLVNQTGGLITGTLGGVQSNGAGSSITNAGLIGSSSGYGVQMTAAGAILNQSGGSITGATGAILLSGAGANTVNLLAGSTTGLIASTSTGARTVSIAGALTGAYNAVSATGVDALTLAATGSMTSASLGAGDDSFTYQGGSFSGLIDGGADTDSFISALGAGSASVDLNNLANFETFAHQSGDLTLTGTGAFSGGASVDGGSMLVDGVLQSAVDVALGGTLGGGGTITGAVSIANGGILANTQGSTLTMGSLDLLSGSTINATFSGAGGPALFAVTGDLTLDGTVNLASTGAYGFGVYGLMTYGGVLTDNGLTIGTVPGGAQRVQVQTSVAGQVNIVHAPTELLFWDGGNGAQHDNGAVNGGSGTWTAAGSEWTDAGGLFNGSMEPRPGFAIFQGAGGTVTVDDVNGAVGVTGMQFAADGYRIEGDAITLTEASTIVRVGDGTAASAAWTATIASALTGAGGLVKTDLGTLILAGESDYTGGTTVNAGALQIGDGATAGSIAGAVVNNAALIFARSDNHDFANDVSGSGLVSINGVVTLSGAITAASGVTILDGSSLTSTGVITASNAVTFANGGAFANAGAVNGDVAKNGAADATVTNTGAISGIVYNVGSGLLTIDNQAGGSIASTGLTAVLSTASGAISLTNAGDVSGASYAVLSSNALDTVTNSGRMVAGSITGGVVTAGGLDAIRLNAGGNVVNQSGGLITGTQGVASYAGTLTLDNQAGAAITGEEYGVHSYAAANIVNAGVIGAAQYAGIALNAGGTITNSGTIGGGNQIGANQGISVEGATTIVNLAGGVINNGVLMFGSGLLDLDVQAGSTVNGTIINAGTGGGVVRLAGGLNGSYAGSSSNDAVTLISDATFSGVLQGNGGVDSFELAGAGAGTLDIGRVLGFESRDMNGAGVWTLTGVDSSTTGWSINSGTLAATGGSAINDAAAITIAGPGTLQLNTSERIGGLNGAGAVALGANTLTVGGGASAYAGVIGGTGNLRIAGGSTLTLSGSNTYSGTTFVTAGALRLGASDVLSDASLLNVASGGVMDLQGFSDTVASAVLSGVLNGTGTLTAADYALNGATVNGNLGAGALFNASGTSTLNGTSAADLVAVLGGSLTLGASDRIIDTADLQVMSGATFDLGAFDETVGVTAINGTLAGTGTLTADQHQLDGATVNASLAGGSVHVVNGASTLNGLSNADLLSVLSGSLTLGASDRIADTAILAVSSGAVLDIGAFNESVAIAALDGTVNGAGTLTAGEYELNGATVNANLGAGDLYNTGGVSTLNGTSAAEFVSVVDGALTLGASDRLADAGVLMVASGATFDLGAFNETVGSTLLEGTLAGAGTLTASLYALDGATVNANLGSGFLLNIGGASTLNGVSAAELVAVLDGSLTLGASDRLLDTAELQILSGATFDLGAFDETVGMTVIEGTLAGAGTLTAAEYLLDGATVNANLGGGDLFNTGGVSTLNGVSGAGLVSVQAGTLGLGASNRLSDTAAVLVASGSTLNLNAFNDTVGLAFIDGALAGTGTLTAAQYQLNGATVSANLGAGTLFNLGGVSTLNGTAAASQVSINAGALRLGGNERLSDAATVQVASGASLNVNGFNERIGALFGTGDVNVGAGRLTFGGAESGFGGRLSGSGQLVHTGGLFTLTGNHTIASIRNTGGELRFGGTTTGGLSASGGSVTGAGTIGGALTVSNGAVLSPGLAGVQNGIGGFTAGGLTLNGGALAIDVLGTSGGNLIDQLRINGTATLTGGLLAPTFQGSAATDFNFSTRYLFLQANNLVGTFANGGTFTAAAQEGLFWRVRYDLAPNAAVLELRELTNFDPGATGTGNQRSVGQALSGGQLAASDDWAAILSLIAGLNAADRAAAFDSISGEPLADVTTSMFTANDTFLTAMRDGGMGGRNDGGEALNFVDSMSFAADGRETSADRLGDVLGAFDPSASTARGAGGWVSAWSADQTLDGKPGQATVESSLNGFAGGYGVRRGSVSIGGAGGVTRLEGDVAARQGHYESDLTHAAGYVAFDDGVWAADLSASFYSGDLNTRRGVNVGAFRGTAFGDTHLDGHALSASVARRFQVKDNTMIAVGASGTASNASVDGYTETGAGGLSLQASGQERDWQSLQLTARATQDYRVNGQGFRIYGGAGVMAMAGDRQAIGDMRFTGAPVGFGTFTVEGAEAPPMAGLVDFGFEVGAGEGVTISAGYRGLFSDRLQDNQIGVKLNASW